MPQPSSPISQAGAGINCMHPDSTSMTTDTADVQTPEVLHGSQKAQQSTVTKDRSQQAAGKHAMSDTPGFQEDKLSSHADTRDTNSPHQEHACCKAGASSKVSKQEKYPRPSSWQRRKAAKLRQGQQELQTGRSSSLVACLAHILVQLICSKTAFLSRGCQQSHSGVWSEKVKLFGIA